LVLVYLLVLVWVSSSVAQGPLLAVVEPLLAVVEPLLAAVEPLLAVVEPLLAVVEPLLVVVDLVEGGASVVALEGVVEPYLPWLSSIGKAGHSFKESGV